MANVKKLEALADAIGFVNDFHNPESLAYKLRNPGLCRAYSFKQLGSVDANGYRIFTSLIGGYRFLNQDLLWKISGQTRAKGETGKLKPTSTLRELLKSFRHSDLDSLFLVIDFLTKALGGDTITENTPLSYFQEENSIVASTD